MNPAEARRILGVQVDAAWGDVRRAYREQIRRHHPDRIGGQTSSDAVLIIEAFRVLDQERASPAQNAVGTTQSHDRVSGSRAGQTFDSGSSERSDHGYTRPGPTEAPGSAWSIPLNRARPPTFERVDSDTIRIHAPADESLRWLLEAAHDLGVITYLDGSAPLFEVLCRFVDEPATSLLVTLQGRADGTDALCSAESIEARPGPPTVAVVDVFENALGALVT